MSLSPKFPLVRGHGVGWRVGFAAYGVQVVIERIVVCFCPKALSFVFCLLSFVWHLSLDSRAGTCCAREFSCVLVVCSWSTRGVAFLCWNTVTTVWCSVGFRSGFRGLVEAV